MIKKILFILKNKFRNKNKISLKCYLKNLDGINLGRNITVNSNCSLDASKGSIELGNNVTLNRYAYINGFKGSVIIGEGSEINNFSIINGTGGVEIGKNVLIGPNVQIISYQHNYEDRNKPIKFQGIKKEKIIIEDDVWIGTSAVILAGVKISKGAIIGANSVITKDVNENSIMVGVPAKELKKR